MYYPNLSSSAWPSRYKTDNLGPGGEEAGVCRLWRFFPMALTVAARARFRVLVLRPVKVLLVNILILTRIFNKINIYVYVF